jgi:hypothetical protein
VTNPNPEELGRTARACLARSGWQPDRRIDPDPQTRRLEADGYTVFEVVREFLARFGELELRYPHFRVPEEEDSCHFDAAGAAAAIAPQTVQAYAQAIGKPVCPIGEAYGRHMVLLMTERGAAYAGYEDALIKLANKPTELIDALCEGRDELERIALPHWFDQRPPQGAAQGSALDELLAQASGPTGPQAPVDLGMPGFFAELSALLSRRNGFTAFGGELQVFRVGEPGAGPELWTWNEPATWKEAYGPLAENLFCFAQGAFGEQHAYDMANGIVVEFDPETGAKVFAGPDLAAWAAWLFDLDGPLLTGSFAKSYEQAHGPLGPDQRLVPVTPFREGGAYELENLRACDSVEALRRRGAQAQRRPAQG